MRGLLKWIGRIVLVLVLAAVAVGLWKREEITRLLAVNSLFSEEKIITNFSNMDAAFLSVPVPRGDGPVSALPEGPAADLPPQVAPWIADHAVTALVVLKDGALVHESYHLGTGPEDRRISWSVAKSYLSALIGQLLADGTIASIDDPVTQYAPALVGGAYDGASVRHVLNMASGVVFDEDYLDPQSDINRMGRVLALGGEMDGFAADLSETFAAPGAQWQYVSIDTHVLSMVVRGATGRSIADLLSDRIVRPMGLEAEPYYLTDGVGTAFVLGGLNLIARDYARFGQMYLQNGRWNGQQIVPADWVAASTVPSAPTAPGAIGYGYQWWIPADAPEGEFMARGVYGQYIYINRARGVVIASNAAHRGFRADGASARNIAVFRAIANGI
ncbi:serine hydrolase [Sulfitobacter albidus]|uniref:Serine hydrolase n=1 Tax=Sulfitobacter albidus TaxID=2829501 RepID=A0A975JC66_9RHOB|nr:serine hydrolase [Sulfitobacter albidus]QUJ75390.1 serine hydrolase [Sulfitobacter albidus]